MILGIGRAPRLKQVGRRVTRIEPLKSDFYLKDRLGPYSARKAFTGSSRKARYAGTRLAINATTASVAPDGGERQRI